MKCPEKGPPGLGDKLPEPDKCKKVKKGVVTPKAGAEDKCNGWTPVGDVLTGDDIAVSPNDTADTAQLFQWQGKDADGLDILCLYLARRDNTNMGAADAEGILCFNQASCEVCAYNLFSKAGPPPKFSDLERPPGGPSFGDDGGKCYRCHVNGPVSPTSGLYDGLSDEIKDLSKTCAKKGGATWIDKPPGWPAPGGNWKGPFQDAGCMGCHTEGFAIAKDPGQQAKYCEFVAFALTDPNGSMDNFTPAERKDCVAFMNGIGCEDNCGAVCADSVNPKACTAGSECCSGKCTGGTCE